MALSSLNHDDPTSPPVHIDGFGGQTSSKIASISGDPFPPLVNSSHVSSPIPNPLPPYKPQAIPFLPSTLQSLRKHHFNQAYKAFDHMF
ncbi:hypothetical protein O181_087239 [Austropuccinia psidii MF-1]|uniref:Uncharacterized protein n=1 Tax=Austropuccinia psidii MF-1 TaxID=1389203 RepID=A0A9Q3IPE2_9BASI|nr:hypothetical protein [Austropuccinia psidii MF-1]